MRIHRLVALMHIPNPHNLPEIDHKDRNKLNNVKTNLRWTTKPINLNNSLYGNNPYLTFNTQTNKFLIYHPLTKKYEEFNDFNDAKKIFLLFIKCI